MGRTLLLFFRWGIFLLACLFLYTHLSADKSRQALDALLHPPTNGMVQWALLLTSALMLANWGVESYKWRWLMRPVERVGPWRALVATIAGTSVGFVTPNRTGEFLGRVLFLAPENRVRGGFATALGSIAQFVVTLVLGGLALLAMQLFHRPLPWPSGWIPAMLVSLTALVSIGALVLYLYPGLLRQLLLQLPFLKRMEKASAVLSAYARHELLVVLLLSLLRYAVFAGQFVLLLRAFGAGGTLFNTVLAIPVVYLISTLVPTMMLTELGVRGSVAVAMFAPLGGMEGDVLLATTVLWLINIVLPALVGSGILLVARIRTKQRTA
ncbi:MAG: lysylphosphatidylglycerol synthase domain-containing protein [Flavobacteriales bacterium]